MLHSLRHLDSLFQHAIRCQFFEMIVSTSCLRPNFPQCHSTQYILDPPKHRCWEMSLTLNHSVLESLRTSFSCFALFFQGSYCEESAALSSILVQHNDYIFRSAYFFFFPTDNVRLGWKRVAWSVALVESL